MLEHSANALSLISLLLLLWHHSFIREKLEELEADQLADQKQIIERLDALARQIGVSGYELGKMIADAQKTDSRG